MKLSLSRSRAWALCAVTFACACSSNTAATTPVSALDPQSPADIADGGPLDPADLAEAGAPGDDASVQPDGAVLPTGDAAAEAGPADAGIVSHIGFDTAGVVIAGSGCLAGVGTTVTPDPLGVTVVAPDMKVDLKAPGATSQRKACVIRVPVEVPLGWYVARVDHRLNYSVTRTAGGTAAFSTSVSLFGTPAKPFTVYHDSAVAEALPSATALRSDTYASGSPEATAMCAARPTSGILALNLALTGQRSATDSVTAAFLPYPFHEGVDIELKPCP